MWNSKVAVITLCLTSFNLIFHESRLALLVSIPQIFYILYMLACNHKYEKLVFYHLLFTFTTLAIPYSQLTSPGDVNSGLYNYSRLKLLGPIAVSQCLLILILMRGIVNVARMRIEREQKPMLLMVIYFTASALLTSAIGFSIDEYSARHFLTYSVYIGILCLFSLLILLVKDKTKIVNLMYILLVVSPISAVIVYLFGFSTKYGNSEIPGMTEVSYFSAILIYKVVKDGKLSFVELLSIVCTFILAFTGATGGKGIVVILFILLIALLSKVTVKTFLLIGAFSILVALGNMFISLDDVKNLSDLFTYKMESLLLLIKFIFEMDMSLIDSLPMSPRVRVIELYLIFEQNYKNLVSFLFGQGYGGWYEDAREMFFGIDLSSAFSLDEIRTNRFYSAHDFFTVIPFFHGLIGVVMFMFVTSYYFFKMNESYLYLAIIPFLLSIYFNNQFGSIAIVMILSISGLNREQRVGNRGQS